jgi:hypothetical protein
LHSARLRGTLKSRERQAALKFALVQSCSGANAGIGNQKVDREQLANSAVRQTNLNSEGALKTIIAAWPECEIIGPELGSNKNERKW